MSLEVNVRWGVSAKGLFSLSKDSNIYKRRTVKSETQESEDGGYQFKTGDESIRTSRPRRQHL